MSQCIYVRHHVYLWLILFVFSLPLSAQRIISMSPALTDMIVDLGQQDKLVGVTTYCDPDLDVPHFGDGFQVSLEMVHQQQPTDIVVQNAPLAERIRAHNKHPHVHQFILRSYDDMCRAYQRLGALLHKDALVQSQLLDIEEELRHWRHQLKGFPYSLVLVVQTSPLMIASSRSFAGEVLSNLGLNILQTSDKPYQTVSREWLLGRQKPIIMIYQTAIGRRLQTQHHQAEGTYFERPNLRFMEDIRRLILELKRFTPAPNANPVP